MGFHAPTKQHSELTYKPWISYILTLVTITLPYLAKQPITG